MAARCCHRSGGDFRNGADRRVADDEHNELSCASTIHPSWSLIGLIMLSTRFVVGMFSVTMMVLGACVVFGQDFPNKSIRIVVSGSGGASEFTVRIIAQEISGPLAQPVIVDSRAVNIAAEIASRASPDGYTLFAGSDNIWLAPLLQTNLPYDPARDFSPISVTNMQPNILVVHPSLPVKSVNELIALAKPGDCASR